MASINNPPKISYDETSNCCVLTGSWHITHISKIDYPNIDKSCQSLELDASGLAKLDSAGAYSLLKWRQSLGKQGISSDLTGLCPEKQALYELVENKLPQEPEVTANKESKKPILWKIGHEAYQKYLQIVGLLTMVGDILLTFSRNLAQVKRFHIDYICSNVAQAGINALPILGLLSFLIGVVLAYQMGLQLETYGANIYIAFLSGMAIFREFGPLITAIIVAGRTSSAFTAQLGSMKINEEIDALETMGLSPTEYLVLPKMIGLTLIFPLLIFWSNLWGILGAMFMSKMMLQVGYHDFLVRLQESVGIKQMMLGLYKAPAFSILIALVGCFQGFQVGNSADSLGHQTTKSVVQALFLIIIADAIYSIIYSALDL